MKLAHLRRPARWPLLIAQLLWLFMPTRGFSEPSVTPTNVYFYGQLGSATEVKEYQNGQWAFHHHQYLNEQGTPAGQSLFYAGNYLFTANPIESSDNDTDGDGLKDWEEFDLLSNPFSFDGDADGISDFDEVRTLPQSSFALVFDIKSWDSDGDYISDYDEFKMALNPSYQGIVYENGLLPAFQGSSYFDYDGDGVYNDVDAWPMDPYQGDPDYDGLQGEDDPAPNDPGNYSPHNAQSWPGGVALEDADQDGINNWNDVYPSDPTNTPPDFDMDGLLNADDPYPNDYNNLSAHNGMLWPGQAVLMDEDGDGIDNDHDLIPYDYWNGTSEEDPDEDGIMNYLDPVFDNADNPSPYNGLTWPGTACFQNEDGDPSANWWDPVPNDQWDGRADFDNDGILNDDDPFARDQYNYSSVNGIYWTTPQMPRPAGMGGQVRHNSIFGDFDNDGVVNHQDHYPDDPWSNGTGLLDDDGDTIVNYLDPVRDEADNYSPQNGMHWQAFAMQDDDNDGLKNWYDAEPQVHRDLDVDGILNADDPAPLDPTNESPHNQRVWDAVTAFEDNDGDAYNNWNDPWPEDALNNGLDVDADGDGLTKRTELTYNTSDEDVDCDDDGLTDNEELLLYETNPLNAYSIAQSRGWGNHLNDWQLVDTADYDEGTGDGIPDRIELLYGLNPNSAVDALADLDGNGVNNLDQYLGGVALNAELVRYDADQDGMSDVFEEVFQLNKYDFNDAVGDADGDGVFNYEEAALGLSPRKVDSIASLVGNDRLLLARAILYPSEPPPSADANQNGLPDWYDELPATHPEFFLNTTNEDSDNDGLPNVWEHRYGKWNYPLNGLLIRSPDGAADNDTDGVINTVEHAINSHPLIGDTDGDGISDANEDKDQDGIKDALEGNYGTSHTHWDTDGDGISDGQEVIDGTDPANSQSFAASLLGSVLYTPLR